MKLQEFNNKQTHRHAAKVLESRLGVSSKTKNLTFESSGSMLIRVKTLMAEMKKSSSFYKSERDPSYLKLLMLENMLENKIIEMGLSSDDTVSSIMKDPKTSAMVKKATAGQNLTPDEQQSLAGLLLMKKETKNSKIKKQVIESEIQQAAVVMAAKDLADRLQGMLEDISEMQYKDLPAIVDQAKNDLGTEQAATFQQTASSLFTQLLTTMQDSKNQMDSALASLTGQEISVPGSDMAPPEDDLGLGLDDNLPPAPDTDIDDEQAPEQNLGRDRR